MKKSLMSIAAVMLAVLLVGCASTKADASGNDKKPINTKTVSRERIDWKGAGAGADLPDWVIAASEEDYDGLPASMQKKLDGKFYLIITTERVRKDAESTKDLKMAQEAAAANYMVNIARSLNGAVDTRFNGALSSNEDSQKSLTATAANARFTGFTRAADSWYLVRVTDTVTQKVSDIYTVIQIYACEQKLWEEQAANYIRAFAKNKSDSEDMKKAAAMADELAASIKPGRIASEN